MNTPASTPASLPPSRPYYWSVRRELWESRSLYLAPLIAGGLVLLGFFISLVYVPPGMLAKSVPDALQQVTDIARRRDVGAIALIMTSIFVGMFYCLDALHGERRDRSILFWKSLPVSDATTVLAKVTVPMAVLPVIAFVVIMTAQLIMLVTGSVVLLARGMDGGSLWTQLPFFRGTLVLIYGLAVVALWYAPVYAWLLLVSAWARRATLLWAILPPLALVLVERLGFGTRFVSRMLVHRLSGGFAEAFVMRRGDDLATMGVPQIDALRFVSSPGLWLGLIVAAALLYAAMRVRRSAEPI